MKNIIKNIALAFVAFALVLSCDEDDLTGQSTLVITSPSLNVELDFAASQQFVEDEVSFPFTITLSEPQVVRVLVYLEMTEASTATEGDDISFPHSLVIPAGSTSVSDVITVHRDDIPEETETAVIRIGTGREANVSSINGQTVSFTLEDYVFCTWVLETSDTYGDGWNGGYVEVITTDGGTSEYAADGSGTIYDILVTDGVDYSFTYVSGGGGFCGGPGYECENYFKLTAPDGTVWEEGSTDYSAAPTEGLIASGTNVCP
jgi:hypothetical protein